MRRQSTSTAALQALLGRLREICTRQRRGRWPLVAITVLARAWVSRVQRREHRPLLLLVASALLLVLVGLLRPLQLEGGLRGMLPSAHRVEPATTLLLLQPEHHGGRTDFGEATPRLLEAAELIADSSQDTWVPLTAPPVELDGWLAHHAFELLALEQHDALRARLTPDALEASARSAAAPMSSPFFALVRDEVLRDPLGLREAFAPLTPEHHRAWIRDARPTDRGDLLSHRGDALLLALTVTDRTPEVIAAAPALVEPLGLRASVVGRDRQDGLDRSWLAAVLEQAMTVALAAMMAIIVLWQRRVGVTLHVLAALGVATYAGLQLASPIEALDVPLVLAAVCVGAAWAATGRARRTLVWLCVAPLPLMLAPYPLWQLWAWQWPVLVGATALAVGSATKRPTSRSMPPNLARAVHLLARPFLARPFSDRRVQLAMLAVALGTTAWAWTTRTTTSPAVSAFAPADPLQTTLKQTFFDPDAVAWHHTHAADVPAALDEASRTLGAGLGEGLALEGPATLVVAPETLERRHHALDALDLPGKLALARSHLEAHGFRLAAFGDVLQADPDDAGPRAEALLESAMGPWTQRFVDDGDGTVRLRTAVHVHERDALSELVAPLRGPVIAAAEDAEQLGSRLLVVLVGQLGLALAILRPRRLASALELAGVFVFAHGVAISTLGFAGVALGPHIVPALLVAGALAPLPLASRERTGLPTALALGLTASLCVLVANAPVWTAFAFALVAALLAGFIAAYACIAYHARHAPLSR